MASGEDNGHQDTVATFVSKLWKIVEESEYKHLISWSNHGRTFVVKDCSRVSKEVFPHFFKHTNFNSFVRQLNLYGFHKVTRQEYGSLAKSLENEPLEYWHTNFRHGHPELLYLVQRRISHKGSSGGGASGTVAEVANAPHHLSTVMSDIHQMKGRQEGLATILEALKLDNTHLRHEIGMLKEKHVRQQKVLNKIIHFLVHMVYKGKIPSSMRPTPRVPTSRLMLMDSDGALPPQPKKIRIGSSDSGDDQFNEFPFGELPSPIMELTRLPTLVPTTSLNVPPVTSIASPGSSVSPPPSYPPPPNNTPQSPYTSSATPPDASLVFVPSIPKATTSEATTSDESSARSLEMQFPTIPDDLLDEYPILPAPSSLVSVPHPENRMCINGQLNHQQLGLDNLPEVLSGHLSVDPSLVSDFVMSEDFSRLPDYDYLDTARLLESLSSSEDADISYDITLKSGLGMLVPVQGLGSSSTENFLADNLLSLRQPQQLTSDPVSTTAVSATGATLTTVANNNQ